MGITAANVEDEVVQQFRPLRGVGYFGMELHTVQMSRRVAHGGVGRIVGSGQSHETGRWLLNAISMRHPHLHTVRQMGEQRAVLGAARTARTSTTSTSMPRRLTALLLLIAIGVVTGIAAAQVRRRDAAQATGRAGLVADVRSRTTATDALAADAVTLENER